MKKPLSDWILLIMLAVVFGLVVFHAPLQVFFTTHFDAGLIIKAWKEIILLAAIPLAINLAVRKKLWPQLKYNKLFIAIIAFFALNFILAIFSRDTPQVITAGLLINLRGMLFFSLVYIYFLAYQEDQDKMVKIGIIAASLSLAFALLQLFLPHDFLKILGYSKQTIEPYLTVDQNHNFVRINGTLRGPNPLGAYAAIVLTAVTAWFSRRTKKFDWQTAVGIFLVLASLVTLWASYSRSAWLGAAAGVCIVLLNVFLKRFKIATIVISVILLVGSVLILALGRHSAFISTVIWHEDPAESGLVNSNDQHTESLVSGAKKILTKPLGTGIGSTGSASLLGDKPNIVENQYLVIAQETGWLGLILYMYVYVFIIVYSWQKRQNWLSLSVFASGVGLAVIGLMLPVFADDTIVLVWWCLAGIVLGSSRVLKKTVY